MKKKEPRKPKYVTTLENEVVRLAKKVKELEATTLRVGQQVRYTKEPETFEDCVNLTEGAYFPMFGKGIDRVHPTDKIQALKDGLAPSEKRAKQLAAIAKMMTVADALNGDITKQNMKYRIQYNVCKGIYIEYHNQNNGCIWFETQEIAEKAIKILGEETIITAFGL